MSSHIIARARAYTQKMPKAISGRGGHTATFNAALACIKGFDLHSDDTFRVLSDWNITHCIPPWTDEELWHKIESAQSSDLPDGYLLRNTSQIETTPRDADAAARDKRAHWPKFHSLTQEDCQRVADLRQLPVEAVALFAEAKFISGTTYKGYECFVLQEGDFAQVRRIDGGVLKVGDGLTKAQNLPGSRGAFIGKRFIHANDKSPVLLVEGAIGLLEAFSATLTTDCDDWVLLAATSAMSRFARQPSLLEKLAGRHVRIIPDQDNEGFKAARIWRRELGTVGVMVDAVKLPVGIKDIGDLVAAREDHAEALKQIFAR